MYSPHNIINTALIPSKECVLKPAGLFQEDLSNPMTPANIKPKIIFSIDSKKNEFDIVAQKSKIIPPYTFNANYNIYSI